MFDFAWTEIALIGVVALVAIGPKDLPVAIKAVSEMVKKARRMAGEFQTHVDEMLKDADLKEMKQSFNELRRMDIKGKILEAVDGDRTIRNTIAENPLDQRMAENPLDQRMAENPLDQRFDIQPAPPPVPVHDLAAEGDVAVAERPDVVIEAPAEGLGETPEEVAVVAEQGAPGFIPPGLAAAGKPAPRALPPAFIPPAVAAGRVAPLG